MNTKIFSTIIWRSARAPSVINFSLMHHWCTKRHIDTSRQTCIVYDYFGVLWHTINIYIYISSGWRPIRLEHWPGYDMWWRLKAFFWKKLFSDVFLQRTKSLEYYRFHLLLSYKFFNGQNYWILLIMLSTHVQTHTIGLHIKSQSAQTCYNLV